MRALAIGELADRTGLAPGTIRMWEQRYGYPVPERTPSGFRRYGELDVQVLKRAIALRDRGLSISAALDEARAGQDAGDGLVTDRPSIYSAVVQGHDVPVRPRLLRKRTLFALSRAIEDEALAHAARPVCFGAFQREAFYRRVEHRYARIAERADATVVFADFAQVDGGRGMPVEIPISPDDAIGSEWAVIVDAPGYAACLLAWEKPSRAGEDAPEDEDRRFESLWTLDARTVRNAASVAATLAGRADAELGEELQRLLADRPLALEEPAPALTALTNRVVEYLED